LSAAETSINTPSDDEAEEDDEENEEDDEEQEPNRAEIASTNLSGQESDDDAAMTNLADVAASATGNKLDIDSEEHPAPMPAPAVSVAAFRGDTYSVAKAGAKPRQFCVCVQ
jgi:hypothetical protein